MQLLARTEAVILDPVYSSKALAGLIDQVRQGRIGRRETVVFVHTGGTPALFAYARISASADQPDHGGASWSPGSGTRPTASPPTPTDSPRSRPISWSGARPWPAAFAGTNTEIGGMIAAAAEHGLELCLRPVRGRRAGGPRDPRRLCGAGGGDLPAGGRLRGRSTARSSRCTAPWWPRARTTPTRRCSPACARTLGRDCPLVATFDIHANLSPALFAGGRRADRLRHLPAHRHGGARPRGGGSPGRRSSRPAAGRPRRSGSCRCSPCPRSRRPPSRRCAR